MFTRLRICVGVLGRTMGLMGLRAGQQPQKQTVSRVTMAGSIGVGAIQVRQLNTLTSFNRCLINIRVGPATLLAIDCPCRGAPSLFVQPKRDHIKFSMRKGRQKTVRAVTDRFFRLHWGAWIHPMIGRGKHLWKKSWQKKQRLRRHMFVKQRYNKLFDHMTTRFWKRPKYYVDDPYEPYHVRNDYPYKLYTKRRPPT